MKKYVTLSVLLVLVIAAVFVLFNFVYRSIPQKAEAELPNVQSSETEQEPQQPHGETTEPSNQTDATSPIMWEVKAKNGNGHIYFLGSVHVGDEKMFPLCEKVMQAYEQCDSLAVECDIVAYENDYAAATKSLLKYRCETGKDIESYLSESTYAAMMNFFISNNVENLSLYKAFKPALWSSLLSDQLSTLSGFSSEYGIDKFFLQKAHDSGKTVLEVESVEFQDDLFLTTPDELYDFMIKQTIIEKDENIEYLQKLVALYKTGSLEELRQLDEEDSEIDLPESYGLTQEEYDKLYAMNESYNNSLLRDRTPNMAEKAIEYLESGKNVFYVVGLAHFIGSDNIIDYMTKAGYEITRVN